MSGFYYFVEGDVIDDRGGRIRVEKLANTPLEYLFVGRDKYPDDIVAYRTPGPENVQGTLLYPKPLGEITLPRCLYDANGQDWLKFENIWVGRDHGAEMPAPPDLRKKVVVPGRQVKDGCGQEWTVPVCYAEESKSVSLPSVHSFDSEGKAVPKISINYRYLWDLAGDIAGHFGEVEIMSHEELMRAAITFLQVNYFLGPPDVFAFHEWGIELFTTEFLAAVLGTASDWSLVTELDQKKTGYQPA